MPPRLPRRAVEVFEEVLAAYKSEVQMSIEEHYYGERRSKELRELDDDIKEYKKRFYGK